MGRKLAAALIVLAVLVLICGPVALAKIASKKPSLEPAISVGVDTLASAAGLLAALATLAAAYAAFRSAEASKATASETREALARGLRPSLGVSAVKHGDGRWSVMVQVSTNSARDLHLRFETTGGVIEKRHPRLTEYVPDRRSAMFFFEESEVEAPDQEHPPDFHEWPSPFPRITIVYSDEREVARWEQTWSSDIAQSMGGRYAELFFDEGPPTLLTERT